MSHKNEYADEQKGIYGYGSWSGQQRSLHDYGDWLVEDIPPSVDVGTSHKKPVRSGRDVIPECRLVTGKHPRLPVISLQIAEDLVAGLGGKTQHRCTYTKGVLSGSESDLLYHVYIAVQRRARTRLYYLISHPEVSKDQIRGHRTRIEVVGIETYETILGAEEHVALGILDSPLLHHIIKKTGGGGV